MDRNGIVEALGKERRVERFAQLYAGRRVERFAQLYAGRRELDADLEDLSQIVYLHLLKMDEVKLRDLWDTGDIDFYIRRVVKTQLFGKRSDYDRDVLRFRRRTTNIDDQHGM